MDTPTHREFAGLLNNFCHNTNCGSERHRIDDPMKNLSPFGEGFFQLHGPIPIIRLYQAAITIRDMISVSFINQRP